MQIATSPQDLSAALSTDGSCITIGNFDGVHAGHRALIARARDRARQRRQRCIVVTFWPHPLAVLAGRRAPARITTREERRYLLERLGVDALLELPFTRELASLSPEAFLQRNLLPLGLKTLCIGYDFSLGKGRTGNAAVLRELGRKLGFTLEQLDPVLIAGKAVSSTRVRRALTEGKMRKLRDLLGRCYTLDGRVRHGFGRGRLLGFPTANLTPPEVLLPRNGVYAVWARYGDQCRPAVTNIGVNPTFGNDQVSIETFLLDTEARLYDLPLRLYFVDHLRDEQRFSSVEALMERIGVDVALARERLAAADAACFPG